MGRVFAISDSRNGRRDGTGQIWAERLGSVWRNFGFAYGRADRIWSVIDSLPAGRARETEEFLHGSSILPDHVRTHGAFRRVRRIFCMARHESFAALESSHVQLGTIQPRDQ